MSYLRGGVGASHLANQALQQQSYSTDAQAVATEIMRTPATQYFTLNSKNRNQNSVTGSNETTNVVQPWNNFRLQRPQALMNSFATRVVVSEVNFPWYIPNISYNNYVALFETTAGNRLYVFSPGFYTPEDFVTSWNTNGILGDPVLSYDGTIGKFTLTASSTSSFTLKPLTNNIQQNQNQPATTSNRGLLWETLGFADYVNQTVPISGELRGNPTNFLYTQFVDIVSDKLNQYSTTRDGSSDVNSGNLVCRLYCSDEISLNQQQAGWVPFNIHRQFKNAKAVMWNKEANIDWLDISVYDEWGFLVPLTYAGVVSDDTIRLAPYPNFQVTMLANEN